MMLRVGTQRAMRPARLKERRYSGEASPISWSRPAPGEQRQIHLERARRLRLLAPAASSGSAAPARNSAAP